MATNRFEGVPVILEVAANGITTPELNPAAPGTPAEIARDALACLEAGASIIHTHTHDPFRPPEAAAALYLEAYRPILEERPDAILYPTVGVGADLPARYDHHKHLADAGVIRAGVMDTGSVTIGSTGEDGLPVPIDYVYRNSASDIHYMMEVCRSYGLGPSVAVFEPGFLRVVLAYYKAGKLPPGTLVKFYLTSGGYLGPGDAIFGAPPIREALDLYLAMLGDAELPWAVAVIGGSLLDSPLAALTLERGGHLRVGLEDDVAQQGNPAEVERARELCTRHGRPLASPGEAAKLLGLPR